MSETPRTDAATYQILSSLQSGVDDVVRSDFARQLERELNAANKELILRSTLAQTQLLDVEP